MTPGELLELPMVILMVLLAILVMYLIQRWSGIGKD
jgi:hypothetical protein